ncbi:MAG TPA: amylo-alpha-1,6-glucosidase [Chryseolinea sp.]|nr:amylo-alpha-1,6-glucosidase [Chryseolinea sp.]
MKFDKKVLAGFEACQNLEWIETNGLGGYASGTVSGAHSRRYHGLLVAATQPPVGRMNVLSKLDEAIIVDETRYELGTNQYPGLIHPQGYKYLKTFERDLFPEFYFEVNGIEIKKTIASIHGEPITVVLYEILQAPLSFEFELLPLYASRDFHHLSHSNDFISKQYVFEDGLFRTLNYQGCPELFIVVPNAEFTEGRAWYYNLEYSIEQQRGMDFREDLYTHGTFSVELKKGDKLGIIISTEDPSGKDAFELFEIETERRLTLVEKLPFNQSMRSLVLAADQFIVKRGEHNTIIAGYHWFADWGRDTMISLPGHCLVTGRHEDAKQIILQFSEYISEGMLPNRFPDHGEIPEYNTIDATLWFFNSIYHYYKHTGNKDFVKQMLPFLEDIIEWHYKGTRYNIKVDPSDELLSGGSEGVQLTWMDAKVGDWVVTPRRGKAVEINALWYNALCTIGVLLVEVDRAHEAEAYGSKARKVRESFNRLFWNKAQNSLFDFVDGEQKNDDMRPNQIYAISLPFPLLEKDRAKKVFEAVTKYLLTPKGLRSLAPQSKDYRPSYAGTLWNRDGSYHNGTVWSFLIGPYVDALFYIKGEKGKKEAVAILQKFLEGLYEDGVGTISEIFESEFPYRGRGCIAQAWSVGEALRVGIEYDLFERQEKKESIPQHM